MSSSHFRSRTGKNDKRKPPSSRHRNKPFTHSARLTKEENRVAEANDHNISNTTVLHIERLADDGRGIAIVNGKTVFVVGALPDEKVTANISKNTSTYSEGRVKQLVDVSPNRIDPPCPVFHRCGGCSVQYMLAVEQVEWKQEVVLSQLLRWSKVAPDHLLPALTDREYGYRQRVRLAVDYTKLGEVMFGFRELTGHAIVNIEQCMVLEPRLQALLPVLRQWLAVIKAGSVSHIELVHTALVIGIVIRHTRPLSRVERKAIQQYIHAMAFDGEAISVKVWFQGEKQGVLKNVDDEMEDPRLHYDIATDKTLTMGFHPQDFIQSNHAINQKMIAQAVELLSPQSHETVMDLFCGIGNFSLPLALRAKQLIGVEGVEEMVVRATANAQYNTITNAKFITQDLSQIDALAQLVVKNTSVDAMLLDPPRSGAKTVCESIGKLSPQRIVYVSCDSSTFARDAGLLADNGYCLSRLGVMDMFPQTSHVEVMALFTLDSSATKKKQRHKKAASRNAVTSKRTLTLG